jgi:hypothetical protein
MSRNAKITVQIWKLNTNKMAEHNELGSWEKKWQSNFFGKTDILFWRPIDFSKAEIDIIAQKKIHLLLK